MTLGERAFSRRYSAAEISQLVQAALLDILNAVTPQKVILFGSAVAGNFDEASDLDFVVVFRDHFEIPEGRKALYRMKRTVARPHDFICVDEETYRQKSELGGVLYVAKHEGRVIFHSED